MIVSLAQEGSELKKKLRTAAIAPRLRQALPIWWKHPA
jgi:hypothetical protein